MECEQLLRVHAQLVHIGAGLIRVFSGVNIGIPVSPQVVQDLLVRLPFRLSVDKRSTLDHFVVSIGGGNAG